MNGSVKIFCLFIERNEIVNLVEVRNESLSAPQPPATQNTDTQAECLTGIYRMERFTKKTSNHQPYLDLIHY